VDAHPIPLSVLTFMGGGVAVPGLPALNGSTVPYPFVPCPTAKHVVLGASSQPTPARIVTLETWMTVPIAPLLVTGTTTPWVSDDDSPTAAQDDALQHAIPFKLDAADTWCTFPGTPFFMTTTAPSVWLDDVPTAMQTVLLTQATPPTKLIAEMGLVAAGVATAGAAKLTVRIVLHNAATPNVRVFIEFPPVLGLFEAYEAVESGGYCPARSYSRPGRRGDLP
jgi:hypothetical protein